LASSFTIPFSKEIIEAPPLRKVKIPNLELYDETANPKEHLGVYKGQMYIQDMDKAMCCGYFSAALKGVAQKWFSGLLTGSITYFHSLFEQFASQFNASRKYRRTSILLSKIRQGRSELLAVFVKRFH